MKTIEYSELGEKVHIHEHASGLKAFVVPRRGYTRKYAVFATHYGSVHNRFKLPDSTDMMSFPEGIAHFLEHKLFDQPYGSVMDRFSRLGAKPNAYTGYSKTAYLFSCTDYFDENLELLLDYVRHLYLTDESVEKEKGIIAQEIQMGNDSPDRRVFLNLMEALYQKNPVRQPVAGTLDSIRQITKPMLEKCHEAFYHPSNMVLFVVGDVSPASVFSKVDHALIGEKIRKNANVDRSEDEMEKTNGLKVERMPVSAPLFLLGFRDNPSAASGIEAVHREIAVRVALELLIGKSSLLYERLYREGLLNNTFDMDYTLEEGFAFSVMGGESEQPERVRDEVVKDLATLSERLEEESVGRISKALKGRFIRQLNGVERLAYNFVPAYFKGVNIFDSYKVYDTITVEIVRQVLNGHLNGKNHALSIVKPL